MNSDRFSRTLTAADANNIVLLLDFNQILTPYEQFKSDNIVEHTIAMEDLHAKVGLFTLQEASWPNTNALASEAEQEAARAKILKENPKVYLELYTARGNGPWEFQGEEILQNKNGLEQPWSLMLLMGTNTTAVLGESLKLGVRIAPKAQGLGGLKGSDYVVVAGTWRKNTKIESKKKDDGIEALKAELEALQLAIYGRLTDVPTNTLLGRSSAEAGVVEAIPNNFITATQSQLAIEQAIFDLAGAAPSVLNTLVELANALNNDANFASSIANQLNTKAPVNNPTFTGLITTAGQAQFPSTQNPSTNPRILDDYQEGTFTPLVVGLTDAGLGTYSTQMGSFHKVGNKVEFDVFVEWSAHTGTGFVRIVGLPFLAAGFGPHACTIWNRNYILSANNILMAYVTGVTGGQGHIVITQGPVGGGAQTNVPLDSAAGLMINGSYTSVN